jgi:hypothetical protein
VSICSKEILVGADLWPARNHREAERLKFGGLLLWVDPLVWPLATEKHRKINFFSTAIGSMRTGRMLRHWGVTAPCHRPGPHPPKTVQGEAVPERALG